MLFKNINDFNIDNYINKDLYNQNIEYINNINLIKNLKKYIKKQQTLLKLNNNEDLKSLDIFLTYYIQYILYLNNNLNSNYGIKVISILDIVKNISKNKNISFDDLLKEINLESEFYEYVLELENFNKININTILCIDNLYEEFFKNSFNNKDLNIFLKNIINFKNKFFNLDLKIINVNKKISIDLNKYEDYYIFSYFNIINLFQYNKNIKIKMNNKYNSKISIFLDKLINKIYLNNQNEVNKLFFDELDKFINKTDEFIHNIIIKNYNNSVIYWNNYEINTISLNKVFDDTENLQLLLYKNILFSENNIILLPENSIKFFYNLKDINYYNFLLKEYGNYISDKYKKNINILLQFNNNKIN